MTITREDVLQVAALARLNLEPESLDGLQRDLDKIVGYVALLNELDTTGIESTAHLAVDRAPLRADEQLSGLTQADALSEAPRTTSEGFAVPAFVEEP